MTRTAIIAAMPAELKPLTRGWQHERSNGVDLWRWRFDGGEWIAACAGAGVAAATRAFVEVEKLGPIDKVVSTGWAGALREELQPGQAYNVSCVIDARTGERFAAAGSLKDCCLVTSAGVANAKEKQRLTLSYNAGLVDMEAAGVARLASMRTIPFHCIKGVSDGSSDQLPDFNRFISSHGQFLLARFILFSLLRPWHWRALMRMGENSRRAARGIAESLLGLLDERGNIRKLNDYPNVKN
jgi:adenosylhomocysteine nucleosidase